MIKEIVLSLALAGVAVFVLNPFDIFMPSALTMTLSGIFLALFVVFAAFMWREEARDEREAAHQAAAGRIGYLAGAAVLAVGLFTQSIRHDVDGWVVAALVVMVLAKVATRIVRERGE